MIEKLTLLTIVVNDQEKALDFYTGVLGFEKRVDYTPPGHPRWVSVGPKGERIEISLFQAGSNSDTRMPQPKGSGASWRLETDDMRKDFQELKSRGVEFEETEPSESPWGLAATFSDPDGNKFSLLQPSPQKAKW